MMVLRALTPLAVLLSCTLVAAEPTVLALTWEPAPNPRTGTQRFYLSALDPNAPEERSSLDRVALVEGQAQVWCGSLTREDPLAVIVGMHGQRQHCLGVRDLTLTPNGSLNVSPERAVITPQRLRSWTQAIARTEGRPQQIGGIGGHLSSPDLSHHIWMEEQSVNPTGQEWHPGVGTDLSVMSLTSGEHERIFEGAEAGRVITQPTAWSPDSRQLVFQTSPPREFDRTAQSENECIASSLHVWDVETREETMVFESVALPITMIPLLLCGPEWSPDSESLLFVMPDGDPRVSDEAGIRLHWFNLVSGVGAAMRTNLTDIRQVAWLLDNEGYVAAGNLPSGSHVVRGEIGSNAVEPLMRLRDSERSITPTDLVPSPSGRWLAVCSSVITGGSPVTTIWLVDLDGEMESRLLWRVNGERLMDLVWMEP
jgi:hypothetical protein